MHQSLITPINKALAERIATSRPVVTQALLGWFRHVVSAQTEINADQLLSLLQWAVAQNARGITPQLATQLSVSTHLIEPCDATHLPQLLRVMSLEAWRATPGQCATGVDMLGEIHTASRARALSLITSAVFVWEARSTIHGRVELPLLDYFRLRAPATVGLSTARKSLNEPWRQAYRPETLARALSGVRLPLSHTRALNVIARMEGRQSWNALANLPHVQQLKHRAHVLKHFLNARLVDNQFSEADVAQAARLLAAA